jgi:hypothetical protein
LATLVRQYLADTDELLPLFTFSKEGIRTWKIPSVNTIQEYLESKAVGFNAQQRRILEALIQDSGPIASDLNSARAQHPVFKVFHKRLQDYLAQFLKPSKIDRLFSLLNPSSSVEHAGRLGILMARDKRLSSIVQLPHPTIQTSVAIQLDLDRFAQQMTRWLNLHLAVHRSRYN